MPKDNSSVIYSGNSAHADLLKCLLEGEGIVARLEGKMVP